MQNHTKEKAILVTGGAGYIGSHTCFFLQKMGKKVIVLDKFIHNQPWPHDWATVIRKDFADVSTLEELFTQYDIETVMHFAAYIDVGESVQKPSAYWENNVTKTITLLNTMVKHNVRKFIFSSTCAVYGNPQQPVVDESHPTAPVSPYGNTKLAIEFVLADYAQAQKIQYVSLRYFNVSGACPEFGLGAPITHVTDIILDCIAQDKTFPIFGDDYPTRDGTGIRDYIHVRDIALAHIAATCYLDKKAIELVGPHGYIFNLGTGKGFSVRELVTAAEQITGATATVTVTPRRPGDLGQITADPTKAHQELGWKAEFSSVEEIFASTIESQTKKLGYTKGTLE